jgi:hypothetical protein
MGSQGSDDRATIGRTMRNGETAKVTLPCGEVVRFTVREHRTRVYIDAPAGSTFGPGEDKNLDDEEDRR